MKGTRIHPRARSPRFWLSAFCCVFAIGIAIHLLTARFGIGVSEEVKQSMTSKVFLLDRADRDIGRGDSVVFELSQPLRDWPKGTRFVKRVVGLPGDTVEVSVTGTRVNGVEIAGGLDVLDILKRPASDFTRVETVPAGRLFVVGEMEQSFDSRYWGFVAESQVVGKAHGLW